MIKFENVQILGWEPAIRGMRNPKNSWTKSDSHFEWFGNEYDDSSSFIGQEDLNLMKKLAKGGDEHAKYQRMIQVYVDITAPVGFWHDFDTYAVGTVKNSCSRKHSIFEKPFELSDFSTEHLTLNLTDKLYHLINELNKIRKNWIETGNKMFYREILDLLPMCYNQKATWMGNYQVLARIYRQRQNHPYDEFHTMCKWIETLPYSEIITGKEKDNV